MKSLVLVVDMYGCPNRCKHYRLGHMLNYKMADNADKQLLVELNILTALNEGSFLFSD